jgi:LPS sulfotransferase NodH
MRGQRRYYAPRGRVAKNFIILCHGRSGSTFLQKELHRHSTIHCYGELYHEKGMRFLISESNSFFTRRQRDPIGYIDYMYARRTRHNIVGSKILYPEISKAALDILCKDQTFNVIFLYRKNILETAVSMIITGKLGLWHIDKGHIPPTPQPFAIDINELKGYINTITTFIETVKKSTNPCIFPVAYEDLINLEMVNKIIDFIGIKEYKTSLTSNTDKLCSEKMYETILNRKEIEDQFGTMYGYLGKSSDIEYWKQFEPKSPATPESTN